MAFSESFDIGQSILKHLEGAIENENESQFQSTSKEVLEVVDESPTSNVKMNKTRSGLRSVKKVFFNNTKEKSIESRNNVGAIPKITNISESVKSEINFKENLDNNIKFETFSFCSVDLNECCDVDFGKNTFACNESNIISKKEIHEICDKTFDDEKNKSFEAKLHIDLKIGLNDINDQTFDLNMLNATQNPSFLYIPINSEDKIELLTEELRKSKRDISLVNDEEDQNFLNLTAKFENLSTSEKPLLHFSISSDDSMEENTDKNQIFEQNSKSQSKIISENINSSFKWSSDLHFSISSDDSMKENTDKNQIFEQNSKSQSKIISENINSSFKWSSEVKETIYEHISSFQKINNLEEEDNKITDMNMWNLPVTVLNEYKKKGIATMFDWQAECLSNPKVVFEHKNLVYSAPTSAGKTLISEILSIKSIVERNKKVIFILPFVSVVREKMFYLQDLLSSSGYRVEGFFGGYSPPGGFDTVNLAICTIEKANSIINRLLEQAKMENLGCVVIDEIHLISDPGRGYILELLLAKILYVSKKLNYNIQIITMSATLPNCELLASWLNAEMYLTDFRPVELKEMIKIGKNIYNKELNLIRVLDSLVPEIQNDQDDITFLSIETILQGCSVIIFCPSKEWCENLSQNLVKNIKSLCNSKHEIGLKMLKIINKDMLLDVIKKLKSLVTGYDKILKSTVEYGCAFHHAGLTVEERDVVESTFKSGLLKIIVATSTLSSGVNLPARRVIIRTPLFGRMPMDSLTYKQMTGRAGRTGKDTLGESILICSDNNAKIGKELVTSVLKPISSCLGYDNGMHLKRALLEIISSGVAKTHSDLFFFFNCTLYNISNTYKNPHNKIEEENPIQACINFLKEYEFIRIHQKNDLNEAYYVPSRLGKACLASSLPPTDGIMLFSELQRSRRCFVLESELHAVYLVTPYSVCYQLQNIDWLHFLDVWEQLSPGNKKVAEIIGVKESFLVRAMRCQNKLDLKLLQIHKRFYSALALQELVNEVPISSVATKFKFNRGLLQSLQQMSSTFASIVTAFCDALNWKTLSLIVSQFKERLYFGVHRDLIDLMRLPDINSQRARSLFNAGIENLVILANSHVFIIEKILYDSLSFESSKKQEGENDYEVQKRNLIRKIYVTGKNDLSIKDAAEMLVNNARMFLQYEIGVKCNWENESATNESTVMKVQNNKNFDNIVKKNNVNQLQDKHKSSDRIEKLDDNVEGCVINKLNNSEEEEMKIDNLQLITGNNDSVIFNSPLTKKTKFNSQFLCVNSEEKSESIKDYKKIEDEESIQISVLSNGSIIKEPNLLNNLINNQKTDLTSIEKTESITIIDTVENLEMCQNYLTKILEAKHVGFSVGIEKLVTTNQCKAVIGSNILSKKQREIKNINEKQFMIDNMYYVVGVSFSLEENKSIFIDLQNLKEEQSNIPHHNLEFLQKIFSNKQLTLRIYDSKEQIKILEKVIIQNFKVQNDIEDPKIASWLLEPDVEMNISKMVSKYAPKYKTLLEKINHKGFQGLSVNCTLPCTGRIRACYDACITNSVLENQLESLKNFADGQMKKFFHELEMPIQKILAHCEVVGFSINTGKIEKLTQTMFDLMKKLETNIYQLHGSHFNLSSTAAVARVLGLHRKPNNKLSTSKQILERIDSPISNLILNYRKISTIFTKNIKPLQKVIQNDRIHGNSFTISSTGRISMYEPNIQNVAKDFNIELDEKIFKISCRSIFLCPSDRALLSADFCQLEMRILTHLSQDKTLKTVIHSNKDIFTAIAAKWNKISENDVSEKLRNGTKQICYGIIYGMGTKSLSENLKCTEQEALSICEQFHSTYPGIRAYIQKIIRFAKQNGFVETITGRRRYLEHINSFETSLKNQAERQSVNTTIQGSAADIVKSAILRMEKNLMKYNLKLGINIPKQLKTQVEFVLHLHDELIYEVPENKVRNVAKVLKATMENCVKLSVPLKVKLKSGKSWGEMIDLDI